MYAWFLLGIFILSIVVTFYVEMTDKNHGMDLNTMEPNGFIGGWFATFMGLFIIGSPIFLIVYAAATN